MYNCIIVGAGVIGAAVSRELSRYQADILVLEKGEDVCGGTSKANSGLVHAGFDATIGSLKAKMNVKGNAMMEELCHQLSVPFSRTGALVLASSKKEREILKQLLEQGEANGVPKLSILEAEQLYRMEPNLAEGMVAGLLAETAGIVCPFELTVALAENANMNGVKYSFLSKVTGITKKENTEGVYYELRTEITKPFRDTHKGIITEEKILETRCVVNCAGVYSDVLHNMVDGRKYHIIPRRGEYCLLDKETGAHVTRTIFKVPGPLGKGILVTPTVHGNLLLGPTAEDILDKEGTNTTADGLEQIGRGVSETVKTISVNKIITSFAGLRAHEEEGDFIVQEAEGAAGFFDAVGIESPGLSAAPAIGEKLAEMVADYLHLIPKQEFIPYRESILHFQELSLVEQKKLIKAKPEYGNIVCRCETVTEGEVLNAIYRPLGAKSLDGIKRRTRAGMGRCQSGFCSPKVLEILAKAYHIPETAVSKCGPGTEILCDFNKEEQEAWLN